LQGYGEGSTHRWRWARNDGLATLIWLKVYATPTSDGAIV